MSSTISFSTTCNALESLLSDNQGVVIGERHDQRASSEYLIESMEAVKDLGVRYIFAEDFPMDTHQIATFEYMNSAADAEMPEKLERALRFKDVTFAVAEDGLRPSQLKDLQRRAQEGDVGARETLAVYSDNEMRRKFNRSNLYKKAKENGIYVIQIDHTILKGLGGKNRLEQMNTFASKVIYSMHLKKEKFIVLTGIAHSTTTLEVPGLSERLKAPLIHVQRNPDYSQRERLSASSISYRSGDENYNVDLAVIMPQTTVFDEIAGEPSQEDLAFFE